MRAAVPASPGSDNLQAVRRSAEYSGGKVHWKPATGMESFGGNGQTGPMTDEAFRRQRSIMILESLGVTQGDQQVKPRVFADVIPQFHGEVLHLGDNEGALAGCGTEEDILGESEQFLRGGGEVASAAGVDGALAGF